MTVHELVTSFLQRIRGLDPDSGWLYYLDLLDQVEAHREELRGATWPEDFPDVETATYRGMLILVEDELRNAIKKLPLAKTEAEFDEIAQFFTGLFASFAQRADAIAARLDESRTSH